MSNAAIFQNVAVSRPKRSTFDLSHDVKLSTDPGVLTPVLVMDVVPGDYVNLAAQALVRFSPLISPLMHRVNVAIHYFFVPNRILWKEWEHFITKTPNEFTTQPPVFPFIYIDPIVNANTDIGSLYDYLGLPIPEGSGSFPVPVSALPFAAYQRIYMDYYKWKGNMEGDITPSTSNGTLCDDGANDGSLTSPFMQLKRRGWMHDYFTSALTASQKGQLVDIPLGDVILNPTWNADGEIPTWRDTRNQLPENTDISGTNVEPANVVINGNGYPYVDQGNTTIPQKFSPMSSVENLPLAYDPEGSLKLAPVTINELRRAESLQTFLELLARGGSRYTELVKNFFDTNTGDARVQRSEYICGTVTPVQISEVLNTTGTTGQLAQGNMAGHGAAVVSGNAGGYHCKEHGYIMGIMSIMPDTAYQQGIPKHFSKFDVEDFFFPQFEGLGEQAILNKELFVNFDSTDEDEFGYIPRHSEYKYIPNRVAGEFRDSLSFWHWGRIFAAPPLLNQTFIDCDPRDDIYAVTSGTANKLYCHVYNKIIAQRPMRKYTIPSL